MDKKLITLILDMMTGGGGRLGFSRLTSFWSSGVDVDEGKSRIDSPPPAEIFFINLFSSSLTVVKSKISARPVDISVFTQSYNRAKVSKANVQIDASVSYTHCWYATFCPRGLLMFCTVFLGA